MTSPRDASPTAIDKSRPKRVLVILGTRPEAIKLCPLVRVLRSSVPELQTFVCATAQHREMLDQVLQAFDIRADFDLHAMQPNQSLTALSGKLISALEPVFDEVAPDLAVVQGDTTTTFCGAYCAFLKRVPVAHVEAGLRTGDLDAPFPEEGNRVLTARITTLHFAPTESSAENLRKELVPPDRVFVTGNTGVDAVLQVSEALASGALSGYGGRIDDTKKLIVVTAHRRESFGEGFRNICEALAEVAERPDVQMVWPVHRNPAVRSAAEKLAALPRVDLIDPLPYVPFVDLLRKATILLTDSGGIQEEAPSLGKPVLVLRDKTERPEAVQAGTVLLVGSDRERIVKECNRLLDDEAARQSMARVHNPYGDGSASVQIARHIAEFLNVEFAGPAL